MWYVNVTISSIIRKKILRRFSHCRSVFLSPAFFMFVTCQSVTLFSKTIFLITFSLASLDYFLHINRLPSCHLVTRSLTKTNPLPVKIPTRKICIPCHKYIIKSPSPCLLKHIQIFVRWELQWENIFFLRQYQKNIEQWKREAKRHRFARIFCYLKDR